MTDQHRDPPIDALTLNVKTGGLPVVLRGPLTRNWRVVCMKFGLRHDCRANSPLCVTLARSWACKQSVDRWLRRAPRASSAKGTCHVRLRKRSRLL